LPVQGSQGPPRPRVEEELVLREHPPDLVHPTGRVSPTELERPPAAEEAAQRIV